MAVDIEIRKDVAYRDVVKTLDNVITKIANSSHIDLDDKDLFPALNIKGELSGGNSSEVIASRLDVGRQIIIDGDIKGKIYENGDRRTEGVFDGTKDVTIIADVKSIEDMAIDNFFVRDSDGKLTPTVKNAERVTTYIKDNKIEDIFDYKNSSNGTYCKNANKAKEFSLSKNIILDGDIEGSLKTFFNEENNTIHTTLKSECIDIILDVNNWRDSESSIGSVYTINSFTTNNKINNSNIKENSNVFITNGIDITKKQLFYMHRANIQFFKQSDGEIKIICYGIKPKVELPLRIMIMGKEKDKQVNNNG